MGGKNKASGDFNAMRAVDKYVGARLKFRRKEFGISQAKLGDMIGVTFQQIQKYERGENRIGASTLYEFAKLLKTDVAYFFKDYNIYSESLDNCAMSGMMEKNIIKLNRIFRRITNSKSLDIIIKLVDILEELERTKRLED